MGRPNNAEARRAQIADAFVGLLAGGSMESITIAATARSARLAPGLVHHYFTSKDEIMHVAVERLAVQLEVRLATRLEACDDDPQSVVASLVDAWLALGPGEDPRAALAWVAIGDEARRRDDVRTVYVAALARVVARTEVVLRRAGVEVRRARKLAQQLSVVIEGALRVGAGGGLAVGSAAPLVRGIGEALVSAALRSRRG